MRTIDFSAGKIFFFACGLAARLIEMTINVWEGSAISIHFISLNPINPWWNRFKPLEKMFEILMEGFC